MLPTLAIINLKSIKNADTAELKGYDAAKKVSGIKIHMGVDTLGLPLSIYATTANVSDKSGASEMPVLNRYNFLNVKKILVDGGYIGTAFADYVKKVLQGAEVEVVKRNELHTFAVLPKRWIVERSFGWLEKNRRMWKNCERRLQHSLQFTVLAFISILLKRY